MIQWNRRNYRNNLALIDTFLHMVENIAALLFVKEVIVWCHIFLNFLFPPISYCASFSPSFLPFLPLALAHSEILKELLKTWEAGVRSIWHRQQGATLAWLVLSPWADHLMSLPQLKWSGWIFIIWAQMRVSSCRVSYSFQPHP